MSLYSSKNDSTDKIQTRIYICDLHYHSPPFFANDYNYMSYTDKFTISHTDKNFIKT